MKKYIAPACEKMNLAPCEMLALSFKVDPDTNTDTQLSNGLEDHESDWED